MLERARRTAKVMKNEARNKTWKRLGIYERVGADVTGIHGGARFGPQPVSAGKPAITRPACGD